MTGATKYLTATRRRYATGMFYLIPPRWFAGVILGLEMLDHDDHGDYAVGSCIELTPCRYSISMQVRVLQEVA